MSTELTEEQQARIEANRQRALEKRKQAGQPTPQQATPVTEQPLKKQRPSKMSSGYYDYNLTTMRDTRAGYLEEPQQDSPEKKRRVVDINEIPYAPDPDECPICCECDSMDLDLVYLKVFKIMVCKSCIESIPDKYSLLTKTEAKDDYLLTDSELRDRELFPVWEKANPHKSTWNNMLLYLRKHLEEFAIRKWGSLEGLDREFERRVDEKRARKEKKYKQSVADLRRRTRVEEWEKNHRQKLKLEQEHEHVFESTGDDTEDGGVEQRCTVCGLVVEVEELLM
ncbi:DNA repair protein rad14 [Coemansia sp. Benny D115]|nr:DNA repair protein rad14 [Coemansia sp. Benny D115]